MRRMTRGRGISRVVEVFAWSGKEGRQIPNADALFDYADR